MTKAAKVEQRPIIALFLRLGSALAFATMSMLVKLAGEHHIPLPQIMVGRQIVPVIGILIWLGIGGGLARLGTRRMSSHVVRSVTGMLGMVCTFSASMLLPLPEATTLGFTAPLFAVLIGSLVLREHVGPWRWTAVALGFAGVLVITQPGSHPIPLLGALAGLGAGLIVAIISYQIREMGRTEESVSIVFYFSFFGTIIAMALLPFVPMQMPDPVQLAILFGIGFAGLIGQLMMTASLRRGAVVSVIVMDYSALIWATGFGWSIWNNLPPITTWLGAPLIVAAGMIIAVREHQLVRKQSPLTAAAPIQAEPD